MPAQNPGEEYSEEKAKDFCEALPLSPIGEGDIAFGRMKRALTILRNG